MNRFKTKEVFENWCWKPPNWKSTMEEFLALCLINIQLLFCIKNTCYSNVSQERRKEIKKDENKQTNKDDWSTVNNTDFIHCHIVFVRKWQTVCEYPAFISGMLWRFSYFLKYTVINYWLHSLMQRHAGKRTWLRRGLDNCEMQCT